MAVLSVLFFAAALASAGDAGLGKRLFFDKSLSWDGKLACASCHDPKRAFTDGRPRAVSGTGKELGRNTLSVFGAAGAPAFFWDGRAGTLEEQALEPFLHADEMGLTPEELAARTGLSTAAVAAAVASYVRTLEGSGSAFDRKALGPGARRGWTLFQGRAGCAACHAGPRFSDGLYHAVAVPREGPWKYDPGRRRVDPEAAPYSFRTPGLRNAALTGPYMHNGSVARLEDAVRHPLPSVGFESLRDGRDGLAEADWAALVEFLRALTEPSLEKGFVAGPPDDADGSYVR